MITGDNRAHGAKPSRASVGIDEVIAEVLPDGKVGAVDAHAGAAAPGSPSSATASTTRPALAAADVGLAIGTGTDIAIESADVVLMSGDLRGVVDAIALSQADHPQHPPEPVLGLRLQRRADPGRRRRALPARRHPAVADLRRRGDGAVERLRGRQCAASSPLSRPSHDRSNRMNIGQAAEASGVSAKMIRYYESIGLIAEDGSNASGLPRLFRQRRRTHLRFIRRARDLGFSVEQIGELVSLWRDRSRASTDVKRLALDHVSALERKASALQAMADTLRHLADNCHGDDRPDCPIIAELEAPGAEAPGPAQSGRQPRVPVRRGSGISPTKA